MKIIKASVKIYDKINPVEVMQKLEAAARNCYQSEAGNDTAEEFIRRLIKRGHESVIEHQSVTVVFTVDRGISHEIVRHRLASYSQESTRYCDYSKGKFDGEITLIEPFAREELPFAYDIWELACHADEAAYKSMLANGCKAQDARAILPNSLKTTLFMTANLREWRHFFKMRCSPAAHPQIRAVAKDLLNQFNELLPAVFGDLV